jgi:hypothetical protein
MLTLHSISLSQKKLQTVLKNSSSSKEIPTKLQQNCSEKEKEIWTKTDSSVPKASLFFLHVISMFGQVAHHVVQWN